MFGGKVSLLIILLAAVLSPKLAAATPQEKSKARQNSDIEAQAFTDAAMKGDLAAVKLDSEMLEAPPTLAQI